MTAIRAERPVHINVATAAHASFLELRVAMRANDVVVADRAVAMRASDVGLEILKEILLLQRALERGVKRLLRPEHHVQEHAGNKKECRQHCRENLRDD